MTQTDAGQESIWIRNHMIAAVIPVIIAILVVVAGFRGDLRPFEIWIGLLALLLILSLIVSRGFTRSWLGILIDDRNKYSLSRLQMLLWTVMILSAFLAAVLANIQLRLWVSVTIADFPPRIILTNSGRLVLDALVDVGVLSWPELELSPDLAELDIDLTRVNLSEPLRDGLNIIIPRKGQAQPILSNPDLQTESNPSSSPLSVQIPTEVWLLLGISTTSLVASPLIQGQKSDAIIRNQSASQAKLSDLFKGEESGNFNLLDLGKVQLFYVTLVVVGGYAIAVAYVFLRTSTFIAALPALDGGVVAMLGVSHAGYLSNKAVSHSEGSRAAAAEPASLLQPDSDPDSVG